MQRSADKRKFGGGECVCSRGTPEDDKRNMWDPQLLLRGKLTAGCVGLQQASTTPTALVWAEDQQRGAHLST